MFHLLIAELPERDCLIESVFETIVPANAPKQFFHRLSLSPVMGYPVRAPFVAQRPLYREQSASPGGVLTARRAAKVAATNISLNSCR